MDRKVVGRLCHCSKSWKELDKSWTHVVVSLSITREGQTALKRNLLPVAQANGKDREFCRVEKPRFTGEHLYNSTLSKG
jgi:hypothetical protein